MPEVQVVTAGTKAQQAHPVHMLTTVALAEFGFAEPAHSSQLLTDSVVADVGLVLTAERTHRAAVLALRPDLLRRTFTFLEFVALAQAVSPQRSRDELTVAMVDVIAQRGLVRVGADDLPDPIDQGAGAHRAMVATVVAAVDRLTTALCVAPVTGSVDRA